MECWAAMEIHWFCALRHALCALLFSRGAAGEENLPIGFLTAGIASAGSPRTDAFRQGLRELRVRGRGETCHRVSIRRGTT